MYPSCTQGVLAHYIRTYADFTLKDTLVSISEEDFSIIRVDFRVATCDDPDLYTSVARVTITSCCLDKDAICDCRGEDFSGSVLGLNLTFEIKRRSWRLEGFDYLEIIDGIITPSTLEDCSLFRVLYEQSDVFYRGTEVLLRDVLLSAIEASANSCERVSCRPDDEFPPPGYVECNEDADQLSISYQGVTYCYDQPPPSLLDESFVTFFSRSYNKVRWNPTPVPDCNDPEVLVTLCNGFDSTTAAYGPTASFSVRTLFEGYTQPAYLNVEFIEADPGQTKYLAQFIYESRGEGYTRSSGPPNVQNAINASRIFSFKGLKRADGSDGCQLDQLAEVTPCSTQEGATVWSTSYYDLPGSLDLNIPYPDPYTETCEPKGVILKYRAGLEAQVSYDADTFIGGTLISFKVNIKTTLWTPTYYECISPIEELYYTVVNVLESGEITLNVNGADRTVKVFDPPGLEVSYKIGPIETQFGVVVDFDITESPCCD